MRVDLRVVAAFVVLSGAAAAQQTTPQTSTASPAQAEPVAASEGDDGSVVGSFLDWLKRHADEPQARSGNDWDRQGGGGRDGGAGGGTGGGGAGGGDNAGGGDHGGD
jgi:hypothetical protein